MMELKGPVTNSKCTIVYLVDQDIENVQHVDGVEWKMVSRKRTNACVMSEKVNQGQNGYFDSDWS